MEPSTETVEEILTQAAANPSILVTYFQNAMPAVISWIIKLIIAIIVLLIGKKIINAVVKGINKGMEKAGKVDPGVRTFLTSLIRYALYFLLVMIILGTFGVTTGSVVAVLGSAGLTIGLALQGSLANFAGGVLILILKPFRVGDYIVDGGSGKEGTVSEISIFYTKLLTVDNKTIMIPNGALSNSTVTNVSKMPERRVDIVVGVAYDSDLSKVKAVLSDVVKAQKTVLADKPVDIFVDELADSSVNMGVRVWVKAADYFATKWALTEDIKNAFDANQISIPFPQLDIHTDK